MKLGFGQHNKLMKDPEFARRYKLYEAHKEQMRNEISSYNRGKVSFESIEQKRAGYYKGWGPLGWILRWIQTLFIYCLILLVTIPVILVIAFYLTLILVPTSGYNDNDLAPFIFDAWRWLFSLLP